MWRGKYFFEQTLAVVTWIVKHPKRIQLKGKKHSNDVHCNSIIEPSTSIVTQQVYFTALSGGRTMNNYFFGQNISTLLFTLQTHDNTYIIP